MSVSLDGDIVRLGGACGLDEAEALLAFLQAAPDRGIDLSDTGHLHAAVVQVLLAFRPPVAAAASEPFLNRWLMPILGARPHEP